MTRSTRILIAAAVLTTFAMLTNPMTLLAKGGHGGGHGGGHSERTPLQQRPQERLA